MPPIAFEVRFHVAEGSLGKDSSAHVREHKSFRSEGPSKGTFDLYYGHIVLAVLLPMHSIK